jgi:serine/threonine protein phosphatase PrpC
LSAEIKSLIISSDGVWEFLSNEDILKKIKSKLTQSTDPEIICKAIVKEANKCWKREDIVRDDITICVLIP